MKEEETDWMVYHLLRDVPVDAATLVAESGLPPGEIQASLDRLERSLLIERSEGKVRLLTFGESLLLCQIKYANDMPVTFENGVVKERKR